MTVATAEDKEPVDIEDRDDAELAWTILSGLRKSFTNRNEVWPRRRRIRLRQEDVPVPEAYSGTALRHKALALDTLIATPNGWTTMGALEAGDTVFDEQGKPTLVLAVTPVLEGNAVFKIVFNDGSVIRADAGHYWLTTTRSSRRIGGQPQRHDTQELFNSIKAGGKQQLNNHAVAVAAPLQLPAQLLPVDPYLLGLWLGDGAEQWGKMAIAEAPIVEAFAVAGYLPRQQRGNPYEYTTTGFRTVLQDAGVIGNKHIPSIYLRASFEQRLALLQGLMDSDGTCKANGECVFAQTREYLAFQTEELLSSLGVKYVTKVESDNRKASYKDVYVTRFFSSLPVFRLQRKLERQRRRLVKSNQRYIVAVEETPSEPVKCIAVDSPSHLFLAGRAMIPTSNSPDLDYAVRQIDALLGENREQFVIYAVKETQDNNKLADETQKATAALMEIMETAHPIEHPRQLIHDGQVADGLGVEKFTFNWEFFAKVKDTKGEDKDWRSAFADYVKEYRELPWRRSVIDPETLYWEFDINGLAAVAEYGYVRRSALADIYEENDNVMNAIARIPMSSAASSTSNGDVTHASGGALTQEGGDLITIVEVWTRKDFFLMSENRDGTRTVLLRQTHPFKRPPYFFAPGIITGSEDPLHKFQPLVLALYPTIQEINAVRTARLNAVFLSSFKPFYIEFESGAYAEDEEGGGLKVHFLMPGTQIPSIKGGKLVPINWTNLDELEKYEATLESDRQRYAFQAVLAGNAPAASGDSTAWATRMLRDQGMIQFNGVLRNYANMRAEEIRFIFFMIAEIIKMDIPIARRITEEKKGVKKSRVELLYLTKEMCSAGFDIDVRLTAGKASDRISIVEEYRRAHQAKEVPMRMVLEEGWQFENVSEILDEVVDEDIREQLMPKAMELIIQLASQQAQDELQQNPSPADAQAASVAQAQAAAQAPAQAGGAAAPPGAAPGGPPPVVAGPGGPMPAAAVTAGIGQGLTSQQIPPEAAQSPMMQH